MTYISPDEHDLAGWLTLVMREAGLLDDDLAVVEAFGHTTSSFNSRTHRVAVRYSGPCDAPGSMIVKRNASGPWGVAAGREETRFYTEVAGRADHPPVVVGCYAAATHDSTGESYVVLEDLSSTHAPPVTRDALIGLCGTPEDAALDGAVDTLAQCHAYWWEHALARSATFSVGHWSRTADRFDEYLQRRTAAWKSLVREESDRLPSDLRDLYAWVLARLPRYWSAHLEPRFRSMNAITLIHGDAYLINFLSPRDGASGPTYLVDWQSPSFDIGAYDLANMCATFWTPEQRRDDDREQRVLRRYLSALLSSGVAGYAWSDLLADYRAGLIFWLLMPVQDRANGSSRDYWWPKMQCVTAAFRDMGAEELLDL